VGLGAMAKAAPGWGKALACGAIAPAPGLARLGASTAVAANAGADAHPAALHPPRHPP